MLDYLIPRDPLVYPGGMFAPGFNPSHPAARNNRFTGVAKGNNFIDVRRGLLGTVNGAVAYALDHGIGPSANFQALTSTEWVGFTGYPTVAASQPITLAAIFTSNSSNNKFSNVIIANGGAASNAGQQLWFANSPASALVFNDWTFTSITSGIVIPSDSSPWFAAVSHPGNNNGQAVFVARNLHAGPILTSAPAGTTSIGAVDTVVNIGNFGSGFNSMGGNVAAAMASHTFMPLNALLAWAEDPWAFWYPCYDELFAEISVLPIVAGAPLAPTMQLARSGPGLGPRSHYTALLNAALPTPAVAPTITGGTLPMIGVG